MKELFNVLLQPKEAHFNFLHFLKAAILSLCQTNKIIRTLHKFPLICLGIFHIVRASILVDKVQRVSG